MGDNYIEKLKNLSGNSAINQKQVWYDLSLNVFHEECREFKSKNDLIKAIAFTYSWMPRIPTIRNADSINASLLQKINDFVKGKSVDRQELVSELVPIIDNSIIAVSKVLHFLAPQNAPIIDNKIVGNWNALFEDKPDWKLTKKVSINSYLKYWNHLDTWLANCSEQKSYRDIELLLFKM